MSEVKDDKVSVKQKVSEWGPVQWWTAAVVFFIIFIVASFFLFFMAIWLPDGRVQTNVSTTGVLFVVVGIIGTLVSMVVRGEYYDKQHGRRNYYRGY